MVSRREQEIAARMLFGPFATRGGGSKAGALLGAAANGLAIDFTDLSVVVRDQATPANGFIGSVGSKLVYTAPSAKLILDAAGVLVSGSTIRTEYDATGAALGTLVEGARTNLFNPSADPANWSGLGNLTAVTAPGAAPTGADAVKLREDTANTGFRRATFAVGVTNGAACTVSAFVKGDGRRYVHFRLSCGTDFGFCLDTQTGVVTVGYFDGTTLATTCSSTSSRQLPGGWWRVSGTFTAGAALLIGYVHPAASATNTTYTGDNVSGFLVWGLQVEAAASVSSHIPTTSGAVTRNADNITLPLTAFPWNAGAGTLTVDGVVTTPSTSGGDLVITPRAGQTHIRNLVWLPS